LPLLAMLGHVMPQPRPYYAENSFSLTFYDIMTACAGDQLNGDIGFYVQLAGKQPARILELGCGTGRVTSALAERGHTICGVDLSGQMLEQARRKLAHNMASGKVHFLQADMCDFSLDGKFDLIIAPFYSFSHLLTMEQRRTALARIAKHLAPDGRTVLHLIKRDTLANTLGVSELTASRMTIPLPKHQAVLTAQSIGHSADHAAQRCDISVQYQLMDNNRRIVAESIEQLTYGWIDADQIAPLLTEAGLHLTRRETGFIEGQHGNEDIWVLEHKDPNA